MELKLAEIGKLITTYYDRAEQMAASHRRIPCTNNNRTQHVCTGTFPTILKGNNTVFRTRFHKLGSKGFTGMNYSRLYNTTDDYSPFPQPQLESSCRCFINSFACFYSFERLNRKRCLHDKAGDVEPRLQSEIHVRFDRCG